MFRIIILAAGKGTRMGSELPKVLVPLKGRPIVSYLLDSVKQAKIDQRPIIVVSASHQELMNQVLGDYQLDYVVQKEQLGTGHAVSVTKSYLNPEVDKLIVLYGDHPFITANSLQKLAKQEISALTIMPTLLPNFNDWHQNFYHWGRIIRNSSGGVEKIIEFKDATEEEKKVLEVNPGIMAFNRDWLFTNINQLQNNNNQNEYYLTDMVKLAFSQKQRIGTINLEPQEAVGINSQAELNVAANLF